MSPHPPDKAQDLSSLSEFRDKARSASELLRAVSHETRLLILYILRQGEHTVSEIEAMLDLQQAVVSQQLARLRMEQLVKTRRAGRMIYYSIDDPRLNALISLLYDIYCEQDAEPAAAEDRA